MDERQEARGHQQKSAHFVVTNKNGTSARGCVVPLNRRHVRGVARRSAALVSPMKRVVAAAQRRTHSGASDSDQRKGRGGAAVGLITA